MLASPWTLLCFPIISCLFTDIRITYLDTRRGGLVVYPGFIQEGPCGDERRIASEFTDETQSTLSMAPRFPMLTSILVSQPL